MCENFTKQEGRARDIHLCSLQLLCSAVDVFMEISTKVLLRWKLDSQEWWILLWPVSTSLKSGTAELHHPHKNIIVAFATKSYSAFKTLDV